MKKLRFVHGKQVKRKEYIEMCTTNEIENIIKTRLNMQAFKCNFKGKDKEIECPVCKEQPSTHFNYKRILGNEELRWRDIEIENIKVLKKVNKFIGQVKEI